MFARVGRLTGRRRSGHAALQAMVCAAGLCLLLVGWQCVLGECTLLNTDGAARGGGGGRLKQLKWSRLLGWGWSVAVVMILVTLPFALAGLGKGKPQDMVRGVRAPRTRRRRRASPPPLFAECSSATLAAACTRRRLRG